jgi:predicted RNA-binding protein Jag
MTLIELQKVLGDRIKIAIDKDVSIEDRKRETELSQTISSLAKQMINNADIVLRTNKLVADSKLKDSAIQKMVGEDGK